MRERDKSVGESLWGVAWFALALVAAGTVGFVSFAHIGYADAFYDTLIILLSHEDKHGFIDPASRTLVILLIIGSFVVVAYLLKWFAEYMIGLNTVVAKRRMQSKIDKLQQHYIVCGLGRVGSQVAQELAHEAVPFVALDRDQSKVDEAVKAGYLAVSADSTIEGVLERAGIERAKALIASLGEDSQNLFVTLAARSLNPNLLIVARASKPENEVKLKRAGADRVALPYQIGGYHMANMALRPSVIDYMDIVTNGGGRRDLMVEEMVVGEHSKMSGHRLGAALTAGKLGASVIAINGVDGTNTMRPTGKEVIYPGDRLILLGDKEDLSSAAALIR